MFPCTQCGECCRHVRGSELTSHLDDGTGVCRHFDQTGLTCSIYHDRPDICRIDACYDGYFHCQMSRDDFYRRNADACNELQEEAGLPERFRVKL
ncbi:MAG: hypothetical protein FD174_4090 [Geobacteraceae bacterium]|nr:MAG: hypothetical protein FD174_4090 [Geobacteraceae bacterium]